MKTKQIILPIIFGFITACLLVSCKDNEEKTFSIFEIVTRTICKRWMNLITCIWCGLRRWYEFYVYFSCCVSYFPT